MSNLKRFKFGENWQNYLQNIDDTHVNKARRAFVAFLDRPTLEGLSFLDIGCGSGIHSYVLVE